MLRTMLKRLLPIFLVGACAAAPRPTPVSTFKPTAFSVQVTGTGRPVVFIPGLTCSGEVWEGTLAHLAGNSKIQAHVLTIAGFAGQPPIAMPPFLSKVRDDLAAYIR